MVVEEKWQTFSFFLRQTKRRGDIFSSFDILKFDIRCSHRFFPAKPGIRVWLNEAQLDEETIHRHQCGFVHLE